MVNKHMQGFSLSFFIRKINKMMIHYRSIRIAKMEKKKRTTNNTSVGKDVRKLEFSDVAGGNVK